MKLLFVNIGYTANLLTGGFQSGLLISGQHSHGVCGQWGRLDEVGGSNSNNENTLWNRHNNYFREPKRRLIGIEVNLRPMLPPICKTHCFSCHFTVPANLYYESRL